VLAKYGACGNEVRSWRRRWRWSHRTSRQKPVL